MALRRAYADEYAVRVNRAVELLVGRSPADSVRALQAENDLRVVLTQPLGGVGGEPQKQGVPYGPHPTR